MATDPTFRLYGVLKATATLKAIYGKDKLDELAHYTRELFKKPPYPNVAPTFLDSFNVVDAPSLDWVSAFVGEHQTTATNPDEYVIVYEFEDADSRQQFIDITKAGQTSDPDADIRGAGVDIGVSTAQYADHWCPGRTNLARYGHRAEARRAVKADALASHALYGSNVNVVIIDEGLDQSSIKPFNWGGGLNWAGNPPDTVVVGTASRTSHGMMIARSILDLAPAAVLYDVPLIPQRIQLPKFFTTIGSISSAQAVYQKIFTEINSRRNTPPWTGPWILVNAWAIFDRAGDGGDYTKNTNTTTLDGHPLITLVKSFVQAKIDVVFAAGNCGQFCPSRRCGGMDRGPGRSIWGANALPEAITAGAVLSNGTWAGYSAQGPGPGVNGLAANKPDLCAPSDFCEDNDAAAICSGTSTACAMTAGVLAALRSNPKWYQTLVTPAAMRTALIGGARKPPGVMAWDQNFGNGILDADQTITLLPP